MTHPESLKDLMDDLARHAYAEVNEELGLPEWHDQSRGNQCDKLTYAVLQAAQNRGIILRRELHREDGVWHYLLAHESPDARPSLSDIVTDLNPWQGAFSTRGSGLLHLSRLGLMIELQNHGASLEHINLRSTGTIALKHDDQPRYDARRGTRETRANYLD